MIRPLVRLLFLCCAILATPVFAQDDTGPANDDQNVSAAQAADNLQPVFDDQDDWTALTTRVTTALEAGRASNAVLTGLRNALADWRDRFLVRQSLNADRIETVGAQLAALGAAPEDGTDEDTRITARRADLTTQLDALKAPSVLAAEGHAQADGLISEIDSLIRNRQADQFTERVQSPLNPTGWAATLSSLGNAARTIRADVAEQMTNPSRQAALNERLPGILALLALALVLVLRGRRWIKQLAAPVGAHMGRGQGVARLLLSLGQVVLPFLGLFAFAEALLLTGMAGRRLETLIELLPVLGLFPLLAHWLAGLLLPRHEVAEHPLGLTMGTSISAHRLFVILGYIQGTFLLVAVFADVVGLSAVSTAIVLFPFGLALAWVLYWLGHSMRLATNGAADDTPRTFRQSLRGFVSTGLKLAAILGVICAAIGYAAAFDAIVFAAANTLYVLGLLVLLQSLTTDAYGLLVKEETGAQDALVPVLIGFVFILLALPVLAVIWGVQITDLTELWSRFREGFSIGETRISPSSFLLFAVIFVVGYTVTRLLQAALRTTVLPRTRLDLGAQNAIVAGLGYVGIFFAAIVAITTAGIDLSGLAIVAGALSVGIGFGLQNIVSNFVAGIILLIERPISQGDWIEVGGQMGYVRAISVRSTRIETFDRTDVIIPNADLVSGQVTNWTRGNSVGRVIVPVGVAYGTDTDKVAAILKEIAEGHPMVLMNPAPSVLFRGFGADSLDFEIRAILRDVNWVMGVQSDMNHAINKRFTEEGIEIPFAQRDLWLRNPETLTRGAAPSEDPDT